MVTNLNEDSHNAIKKYTLKLLQKRERRIKKQILGLTGENKDEQN